MTPLLKVRAKLTEREGGSKESSNRLSATETEVEREGVGGKERKNCKISRIKNKVKRTPGPTAKARRDPLGKMPSLRTFETVTGPSPWPAAETTLRR